MFEIFNRINFVDIFLIFVGIRIFYISFEMGLPVELFKLLGIIFSTYISLHYYTALSDLIQNSFIPKQMPLEFLDFLVFMVLALGGYLGFIVLRNIFYRFLKLDASPRLSQIGGLILGLGRIYFTTGIFIYILMISSVKYLNESVKHSYFASRSVSISADTYAWLWNNIVEKFSTNEKFNPTVTEVMDRFKPQK